MKNNFIKKLRKKRAHERVEAIITLYNATKDAFSSLFERRKKLTALASSNPDLKKELEAVKIEYDQLYDFYWSFDYVISYVQKYYYEEELYWSIIKYFPKKSLKLIKKSVSDPLKARYAIYKAENEIRNLLYVPIWTPKRLSHGSLNIKPCSEIYQRTSKELLDDEGFVFLPQDEDDEA